MRKLVAGAVVATLVVAMMGTTGAAGATGAPAEDGVPVPASKTVEPSSVGSYIVLVQGEALVDTLGHDQLGTPAADAQAAALEAGHDDVLAEEGIDVGAKTLDYTIGLNGFAVAASYEQAQQLAANPRVTAVVPDELLQLDGGSHSGGKGSHGGSGGTWGNDKGSSGGGWGNGKGNGNGGNGNGHGNGNGNGGNGGHGNGNGGHGNGNGGSTGGPSTGVSGNDDLADFIGLTDRGEAWKAGLTGEGVRIGIIDSGIWPEHPSFADDGSYPAADPLPADDGPTCQFGTSTVEPAMSLDVPFTCNNKLVGAREELTNYKAAVGLDDDEFDSARDDQGHGTHVASTAAGNAGVQSQLFGVDYGKISGIAPRAQIVAYKAAGRLGALTSDIAAAVDQAIADGVDVINLSIGGASTNLQQPNLKTLLSAAQVGIFIATSAGNDGPDAGTIGGAAAMPFTTAVAATTQRRVFQGTVTLDIGKFGWGPKRKPLSLVGSSVTSGTKGAVAIVDGADAGGEMCKDGELDPAKVAGKVVLCLLAGSSPTDKSAEVQRAGGVGLVLYNESDGQDLYTDNAFVPTINLDHRDGLLLKTYVRQGKNPKVTLSVGGTWTWRSAPSMLSYSSRGPNALAADILKPDISAPGSQILAGNSPVSDTSVSAPGQLFQAISGSSMASPVVAGVFALLKQAHSDWSPAMAKSALMTTADTGVVDNDRRTPAGPFATGAGMVDPGVVGAAGSAFDPGLVYDAGYYDYLGAMCDIAPEWFTGTSTCDVLASIGVPTDAVDFNGPSIGVSALPGTATVTRTVTSVAATTTTWKASVQAPSGYKVTVSPSTLKLAPGASATFTVTLTNTGKGRVGQWTTGALTWTSGRYAVRSAIAVQGSAIGAPDAVSGTGTAGSLTFDQSFGYTGAYSATAHGLSARVGLDGTIFQDPDKTIPSGDDAKGGVLAFPVSISGATHARWTLKFPAGDPDDLDLYLVKDGAIVAVSGNEGTNEQIDLVDPADGDYTLYVHGFTVAEPEGRAISVGQWLVPAAPSDGSNLTIEAPTKAKVATTADVTVTWQDLDAGTEYLGSITHADGNGTLAVTLVDVTT